MKANNDRIAHRMLTAAVVDVAVDAGVVDQTLIRLESKYIDFDSVFLLKEIYY
jgi:hypothetical protein